MFSFPEQLSTAHKAQFDTQIDFMRNFTAQVFDTAAQVLALNISTSRASAERAAGTVRQLFTVSDPRDLFTLGAQTQEEFSAMVNYSRELFGIASGVRVELARASAARPAPQPEAESAVEVEPAGIAAPADNAQGEQQRALKAVADKPAPAPRAKTKPMAKAVSKATGVAVELPLPLAANVDSADNTDVKLVDSLPPAADVLALKARKAQRKK
jgi:phasin family protein